MQFYQHTRYKNMTRARIFLPAMMLMTSCICAMAQQSDLFSHKRINLYGMKAMPHSTGNDHRDSIARNRIWRAEQPRLYVYLPGQEERQGAAVSVIPGGGYIKQAYETAGVSMAKWLNTFGMTAFVLLHRLPNQPDVTDPTIAPLADAQRAVKWVRAHAADYGIDPHKIGVMGCSAGAHVAACASTVSEDHSDCGDSLDTVSHRPDFAVLISPVAYMRNTGATWRTREPSVQRLLARFPLDSLIARHTPPMLLLHAADDRTASPTASVEIFKALLGAGVKRSSLHIFPHGGHGIALRSQPGSTALWPQIAEEWLRETGFAGK